MQPPVLIAVLVLLNLALQIFDGIATYIGWERFGEANPLLRAAFAAWGAGPTLLATKLAAVALVLALARAPRPRLVALGLAFTCSAYLLFSFVPWTLRLTG